MKRKSRTNAAACAGRASEATTMSEAVTLEALAKAVVDRRLSGRIVVAIVGAPGSGKSTFAERLEAHLNATEPGAAAILPMDGYHYDDCVLNARGLRAR